MEKTILFTKMHGAGNDFVMLNGIKQRIIPSRDFIRYIADRRFGIGADQVLIVEKPESLEADFKYRIFNCDGQEVEQCGNGARCFAIFVRDEGLTVKRKIFVETKNALICPTIEDDGRVTVDMGCPVFDHQALPFDATGLFKDREGKMDRFSIKQGNETIYFSVVSMGNPHAVISVKNVDSVAVDQIGSFVESHPAFPAHVNVGFLEPINEHQGRIRVWERGAGETLACGTGACAAAVIGIMRGYFNKEVSLHARGGVLTIKWEGLVNPESHVFLTGPVQKVFTGSITLPEGIVHD